MKKFKYEFSLSCEKIAETFSLAIIFPAVSDVTFVSKLFTDLITCVQSSKKLTDDILDELNDSDSRFSSYLFTLQTPDVELPEDWSENEVGRFVILKNPEKTVEGVLTAENIIGQSRIFETESNDESIH